MRLLKWIWQSYSSRSPKQYLSAEYINYAESSYPSNHTYKITKNKLQPKHKLNRRFMKIRKLFPTPLTSLVDIGCSKGFFVFSAGNYGTCTRSVGIDITDYDINFCRQIKSYLNTQNTNFENLQLHELANRIHDFGGPFQTVLLLNIYQYLYFGSDRFADHYLNHALIFKHLREICSGRVIFSNRVNLADCQNEQWIERAGKQSLDYSEEKIMQAASEFFTITQYGHLGRYPLWALDIK
ncbi:MAG: hypothetical protein A3F11_11975 [Gammaproteobacteria bacterium RIFCSPHIGHO2_12_FULL_37_14]|nr:MAG: hypothetical protein A3F11_11975 [Gammaproteobacteria bacterium RIFCSPHIGHO2_12_FULL_37_14]